jgi:hypothetical protein
MVLWRRRRRPPRRLECVIKPKESQQEDVVKPEESQQEDVVKPEEHFAYSFRFYTRLCVKC